MELNENGYPIWKKSKEFVHNRIKKDIGYDEEIHHIDGDKLNFDGDNLIVVSREDHNKLQKSLWYNQNIIIIHLIIILFSYMSLVAYLGFKYLYYIILTLFLLLFALIIPAFPKTLRKLLFKMRILQKNKKQIH